MTYSVRQKISKIFHEIITFNYLKKILKNILKIYIEKLYVNKKKKRNSTRY